MWLHHDSQSANLLLFSPLREDKRAAVVVAAQPAGLGGEGLLIQVSVAEQKLKRCLLAGEVPGHVQSTAKVLLSKAPRCQEQLPHSHTLTLMRVHVFFASPYKFHV